LKGLTFAETPLARSPDSPGASRATEVMLLIAAYKDVPRSARDLEQLTSKQKGVYEIR
jgi:hypothetical protein